MFIIIAGANRGKRGVRGGRNLRRKPKLNRYEQDLKNVAHLFVNFVDESTTRTRANLQRERELREREFAEEEVEEDEQEERE